jgi:uncharacterized membrane protein HdeD (DUF308 family)
MLNALTRNWWMIALRGVAAILFGIGAIAWPGLTIGVFVAFFGAYALVDGGFSVGAALSSGTTDRWWYVSRGVLGMLIGIIAWTWPGLTTLSLLYFIAAWAVVTGVMEIVAAIQFREVITGEGLFIVSGAISVIFGTALFAFPGSGAIALVTTIGIFAIISGTWDIIAGFSLNGLVSDRLQPAGAHR